MAENQFIKLRKEKLARIRALGIDPYPVQSERSHKIAEILADKEGFVESAAKVTLTGRLVAMRRQGKIGFGNIEDDSGKIQLYVSKAELGEENYELFKLCDAGDFIQATGFAFYTQTGEYSLKCSAIKLLAKNIRPLPAVKEKLIDGKTIRYDEFTDIELRYRKRYLDLLLNPEHRKVFALRSRIISAIRKFLDERDYIEVETPILQTLYGGANARPFVTHHNTLDVDLYLRIAVELYLKRLIVGGFERVYEIGKNFRNEGMDRTHNPEFTMLESYEAYSDLKGMMDLVEAMVKHLATEVIGKDIYKYNNHEVNLTGSWRRAAMADLVQEATGIDVIEATTEKLADFCTEHELEIPAGSAKGKLIALLYERFVEHTLIQPTFVCDFPKEISPLAKAKPGNPLLADRFELVIAGGEFANAFSELNDPFDQRERLEAQAKLRALGDDEANVVDEDFLEALEYGMPPMGGQGIGIDRLVMLLTENDSIKEVILFPQMKPGN
ncbi:MAG: lysine--tRNA ligase [Candidatus Cloacimonadaceae bacterium]|jgi:lysyl-tRNA synthetase class 2|nr:lysine--tRNA ligase [Candidatus Cloacimonadota bacterium]MDY0127467.1 lysine--tRNA ligase [Candidatus Cloacimonadaceae bacterium]MCB5254829.1 lysine--tRNA ligase [Candidatus Cloacimonadota bacterium]MCK9178918.1 lysine--tRNA ligase [Candidatus Cloacimonadota bacterium]MCK9243444.1 lysine--tRNA ligase [Candidatus Cloacimonadota bacterium]